MARNGSAKAVLAAACLLAMGAAVVARAAGPLVPRDGELQVSTYTVSDQLLASVASLADGDFLVVWNSLESDGGPFARRLDRDGVPETDRFGLSGLYCCDRHSAAPSGSGFVIAWEGDGIGYLNNREVFANRFDSAGALVAGPMLVNTYTTTVQIDPVLRSLGHDNGFIVVWQSYVQDGDAGGLFGRRLDPLGAAMGAEFQISAFTESAQRYPAIAIEPDGDFVVAWQSRYQDRSYYGVFARRFSSSGTALGSEFQVNSYTTYQQWNADVAVLDGGGFVIVWESPQDGYFGGYGIRAQRFDVDGAPLAQEFRVNSITAGHQTGPQLAAFDGGFVVIWNGYDGGGGYGLAARLFDSGGAALGRQFQVNSYTDTTQSGPQLVASGDQVLATWLSEHQDGQGWGVFARVLAPAVPLDIDANGSATALTDGILALRHMFELTGPALVSGAIASGCQRCDDVAVTDHLLSIEPQLDIDDDGAVDALTDGLLLLRFLFGFTGPTLTSGAVADECTRCGAAEIAAYLSGLV
jgi:hypothetical protein